MPDEIKPASSDDSDIEAMDPPESDSDRSDLEIISPWIQIPVALFAYFGFFADICLSPGTDWHRPNFTPSSLAWLAFAFVVTIVNKLDDIGIIGARFSFRRKLERAEKAGDKSQFAIAALENAIEDYTHRVQSWTHTVNLFDEQLQKYGTDSQETANIVARYCLERMEEARDVIAVQGDRVRFSLWLYVEEVGGLKLLLSDAITDDATREYVFRPGQGLCGQCYVEDRLYNLPDAPKSIYYGKIRDNPQYHGLLLVPVKPRTDEPVRGVLSIDRTRAEEFDSNAENIAWGLAHLLAYAMEKWVEWIRAHDDETPALPPPTDSEV